MDISERLKKNRMLAISMKEKANKEKDSRLNDFYGGYLTAVEEIMDMINRDGVEVVKENDSVKTNIRVQLKILSDWVVDNWVKLEKSTFEDLECVVVFVRCDENEGWGHHQFSGIGITKEGLYCECMSSGCSCTGGVNINLDDIDNLIQNRLEDCTILASKIFSGDCAIIVKEAGVHHFANY